MFLRFMADIAIRGANYSTASAFEVEVSPLAKLCRLYRYSWATGTGGARPTRSPGMFEKKSRAIRFLSAGCLAPQRGVY